MADKELKSPSKSTIESPSKKSPPPYEKPRVKCHAPLIDLTFCSGGAAGAVGSAVLPAACPLTEDND